MWSHEDKSSYAMVVFNFFSTANEKSGFGFGSFVVVWMCSGMKVIGQRQLLVV